MNGFPHLLAPGRIGSIELRNRIVMCPMGDSLAHSDGSVSDAQLEYFAARARGGAALLEVGSVSVSYPRGSFAAAQTAASDDRYLAGLTRLAERVHSNGALIAAQLVHDGGNSLYDIERGQPLLVPSIPPRPRPDRIARMVTTDEQLAMAGPFMAPTAKVELREATDDDLEEVIALYASSAARCVEAGFDGVELHGGHGYLLDAFRSGYANTRTDAWGGSLAGRSRLMLEVIRAVRAQVGRDVPVWMRLNAFEVGRDGGATLDETLELAPMLVAAGLDALHVSAYASNDLGIGVTASHTPHEPGLLVPYAAAVRRAVDVPVITFGRLEPEAAEAALARGDADFVAMGRKLLADPDLPAKLAAGRSDDIRPCIYQYRCIGNIFVRGSIACVANPETAREAELRVPNARASRARRVLVVGGGPAGLEAARRLVESGHEVTLAERAATLGGRLALGGTADETLARMAGWLVRQVEAARVEVRLGVEVDLGFARRFDVVVVATGARWERPADAAVPGIALPHVRTLDELRPWLVEGTLLQGPLVVLGGGKVGVTLAARARGDGVDVTVVEPSGVFVAELGLPGRFRWVHDVEAAGVRLVHGAWESIDEHSVRVKVGDEIEAIPAASVIVAHGAVTGSRLAEELAAAGIDHHRIGDCREVRRVEGAFLDAAHLAVTLAS